MKALKIVGIILLVLVLGIAGFVMSLSGEGNLERSNVINAPAEKVFMVVNDFEYAKDWSPWLQIDPNATYVYSENTVGLGASYTWESDNDQVGTGRQEIIESIENKFVNTRMVFGEMVGDYTAAFKLVPVEGGTEVTWTLVSKASNGGVMEKFFVDYISDKVIGPTYEEGLEKLKSFIEELPDPEPEIIQPDSTAFEVEELM